MCILLCTVSCSKESIDTISIGEDIPFTFTTGNGEIIGFSRATIFTDTAGDFSQIYAHTDGSSAEGLFTLSIQTENCTGKEEGENIKIKEFSFCKPLSSNSKDYTPHLIHLDIPNFCLSVLSKIKTKNVQEDQEESYVSLPLPYNS